jgi:hypothetical protein
MIPLSVNRFLGRIDKKIRELNDEVDFDLALHEIIQDLSHCLDRVMNLVWEALGDRKMGKQKPNVYFPDTDSLNKLSERMKSMGLADLETTKPNLWHIIRGSQSMEADDWLHNLKSLANLKHERPPKVMESRRQGVAIGRGQEVYIESFQTDGEGKIVDLRGWEKDSTDGPRRPLTVEIRNEIERTLESTNLSPDEFVRACARHVRSIAVGIFKEL